MIRTHYAIRCALGFLTATLCSGLTPQQAFGAVREIPRPYSIAMDTAPASQEKALYLVQLDDPPALALTRMQTRREQRSSLSARRRFDPEAEGMRRYVSGLRLKQDNLVAALNLPNAPVYSYRYTFNGLALELTASEAEKLRLRKGVSKVWKDSKRKLSTTDSGEFLGLFDSQSGLRSARGLTGEGVIIGIIDSGIAPGHPSLSDRKAVKEAPPLCRSQWAENTLLGLWLCRRFRDSDNDLAYGPPPADWRGTCETGDGFTADDCNNKLIGARYYRDGFDLGGEADPDEFLSPADADGHGTHIASIAAGNEVTASVFGKTVGRISGMAPRARVAVYKACWLEPGASRASCSVADLQKAIEDAVADGVDIINYSIGDLNDSLDDPDDLALLAAAEAGVLSAVATGNDGPDPFSIQSPATTPWVISVGATSRAGSRVTEALRITSPAGLARDYESREGAFTPPLQTVGPLSGALILANDGSTETPDGDDGTVYDACTPLTNSAEISGNIALVQRGGCNFDQKLANAQQSGASAVVVYSNDQGLIVMDGNPTGINVPAVMIGQADGTLLRDRLLEGEAVSITLDKSLFLTIQDEGNIVGTFSGRGPSLGDSDFLKPDLVAPGTAILAGQTPDVANGFRGELFQYLSGTSQSTPHVAGVAALIKQARPDWGPDEIKSALMTTSRQDIVKEDGRRPADPFDMGAGHIQPNSAVDPGLVYPVDIQEYDAYLCTVGLARLTATQCAELAGRGFSQDARDINLPSIAITELAGSVSVQRRVRNTGPAAEYRLETDVPDGITLEVLPETLKLGSGETAEFTLRFTSDGTGLNQWHHGNVRWVSENYSVFSPFVVQPTLFSAPLEARATGATGQISVPVSFGYDGNYEVRIAGLIKPCVLPDDNLNDADCTNSKAATVADDPTNNYVYETNPPDSVRRFFINVPEEDDALLRVALYDELTNGEDDLDLYLYYCRSLAIGGICESAERTLVGSSIGVNTSNELIEVAGPEAGTWIIDVHGYNTDIANGGIAEFRLYSWAFGSGADAGNLRVDSKPPAANAGEAGNVAVSWQNLEEGLWLGGIDHVGRNGTPLGLTVLEVNVNAFGPTSAP